MRMGIAHWSSRKSANTVLPRMAPSLAATSVTAIAVDLRWVGNSSTPEECSLLWILQTYLKYLTETVQAVEAHSGHGPEDAGEDQVHEGALHHVDEEGGASGEDHREAEEELAAKSVHAEDSPDVTGQRG